MGKDSGGASQQVAQYFISVHFGLCTGPVDAISQITSNDKVIFDGLATFNQTLLINKPEIFGGIKENGGCQGYCDFYLGDEDQKSTTALATRLGGTPDTVPGFRGIASLFFHDTPGSSTGGIFGEVSGGADGKPGFYWIANLPQLQTAAAKVIRYPFGPNGDRFFNTNTSPSGMSYRTANPAHIIYECLTNGEWGMGSPLSLVDTQSFRDCAATLQAEDFGLSMLWNRADIIENFVTNVINHIQAVINVNPQTGQIRLKLLRDDYIGTELPILHPGIATLTQWQRKTWGETANEVVVTWTNPDNEEQETVSAQDNGAIAVQGGVISTSNNYFGVRSADLAMKLALRDLRQSVAPLLAMDFEVNREAWKWQAGDPLELRWPEYGIASMYIRVVNVNYGKPGDTIIKISVLEDIFGFGSAIYTDLPVDDPDAPPPRPDVPDAPEYDPPPVVPPPGDPATQPPDVGSDESPRALDFLYLGAAQYYMVAKAVGDVDMATVTYPSVVNAVFASQMGTATSTIGLWVEKIDSFGNAYYANTRSLTNTGRGELATTLVPESTSVIDPFTAKSGLYTGPGSFLMFVDGSDPDLQEICGVVSIDSGTGALTIQRGLLDTIPRNWAIGSVTWLFSAGIGGFDTTIRPTGSSANYKFTPKTSLGMYPLASATVKTLVAEDRLHLPYRPANVVVDGELWNQPTPAQGAVLVAWSRRNRVTETGTVMAWTDGDVDPETGQTVTIIVLNGSMVEVTRHSGLMGTSFSVPEASFLLASTSTVYLVIQSERPEPVTSDNLVSFQKITRSVSLASWTFSGYGNNYGDDYGGT